MVDCVSYMQGEHFEDAVFYDESEYDNEAVCSNAPITIRPRTKAEFNLAKLAWPKKRVLAKVEIEPQETSEVWQIRERKAWERKRQRHQERVSYHRARAGFFLARVGAFLKIVDYRPEDKEQETIDYWMETAQWHKETADWLEKD